MRPLAHALETKVCSLFCESLRVCASGSEASDWLSARGAGHFVEELAAANGDALRDLCETSRPTIAVLNRPELVHFAVVARSSDAAQRELLRAVESPVASKFWPLRGVWKSYSLALVDFHRGIYAQVAAPMAKGYERFYLPYIHFMCSTTAQEREDAERNAREGFARRNADRRCRDWLGLDGDGERPVLWDFRLYALQNTNPVGTADRAGN